MRCRRLQENFPDGIKKGLGAGECRDAVLPRSAHIHGPGLRYMVPELSFPVYRMPGRRYSPDMQENYGIKRAE
jgi:hypothetical protein